MSIRKTLLLGLLAAPALARAQLPAAGPIRAILDSGMLQVSRRPVLSDEIPVLDAFYAGEGDDFRWTTDSGFTSVARAAIVTLGAAAERGLDPRDYDVSRLDSLATLEIMRDSVDRAGADLLLSVALARYLRELRDGRVAGTPFAHLKPEMPIALGVTMLERAVQGEPVEGLAREVEPHWAQYRSLLHLLARYRRLADSLHLRPLPAALVRPGQRYAGAAELRRRLVAYGDIPATSPKPRRGWYDSTLADGVRHFQVRHDLPGDGVIGPSTRQALAVTPAHRAHQIALALERLRWLPPLEGQRLLVVNIPAFELFAFDSIGGSGEPALRMLVVTGGAFDHRTPVMLEPLKSVEFHPYWNVPRGILVKEILPLLAADPLYLRKARMEIVGARDSVLGDSVTPVLSARLGRGSLRVRQRPGPWNALGQIKFSFPNRADVYFHGTPDTLAFRRARRDVSHGCIRLEDPPALAEWALHDSTAWGITAIDSVLVSTRDTIRVSVEQRTSVLIFYTTAVATPDGEALFYTDYYGHDRELTATLRERSAADTRSPAR